MTDISLEMRRLRWQCRRGLLELDLLFARFLNECYPQLAAREQQLFRQLLQQPDPQLLGWLQRQEQPPEEFKQIIECILQ